MGSTSSPRPNLVPPRPGRTEGPRPLVPSYRDEDEGRTPGSTLNINPRDELADWQARLDAAVTETTRRRQARHRERQELDTARAHGLQQRHAAKLQRKQRP